MSGPVYGTYSQAQLDAQYDQRSLVPDFRAIRLLIVIDGGT
jgi:hypothetical protein